MNRYADIIDHPRHVSAKHPPLPPESRAAQFSPFAALTGYDDVISETARLTDSRIDLAPDETERIDAVLRTLRRGDGVRVEYFVPDGRKEGGAYRTDTGSVRRIEALDCSIELTDGRVIPFDDILFIEKLPAP